MTRLLMAAILGSGAMFAQVTSSSVTVTVSRDLNLQPDQATFSVVVTTPTSATRDDAVSALQGSRIAAANFTGVSSSSSTFTNGSTTTTQTVLQWNFTETVALSAVNSTISQLSTVQKNLSLGKKGISVSFSLGGTGVSPQAQQSQPCPIDGLISDGRAQAQKLAAAAQVNLGSILAMSAPALSGSVCAITIKFSAFPF